MISIICHFHQFKIDYNIKKLRSRSQDFARQIISSLRESLLRIKYQHQKEIVESAAFVVLEQNLAEFVHNTVDACSANVLLLKEQSIEIKIPEKTHRQIKIFYQDTTGGFPKDFMESKNALDFYEDKLLGKKIYVSSQKTLTKNNFFIGGNGLALSQTCRFLKLYHGQLLLKNKDKGAQLIFVSPPRPQNKKPSFHNFKSLDFQNVFAQDEFSTLIRSTSRPDLTLLNIPEKNITLDKLDSPHFSLSSTDSDSSLSPFGSP
ncbi:MAG TPA: hypothetical protein VHM20_03275 [Gammaproteobacteria bacterium]|jgi:hypothetical protein|nr:hypothetical protein [Gammaproteobacteria bacterium]